ncbi:Zn(2)-C6 fungal-type DNA-binding domain profile [Nakaseomyces glabratus]|nr:Zn(2)-C6 fungal-type DNA-binding domain profile [Nakaseomyces glabratus]
MEEPKKVTKSRRRPMLVCVNCRKRKSKCDRQLPCSKCIQHGDTDTCTYLNDVPIGKKNNVPNTQVTPNSSSPSIVINLHQNGNDYKTKNLNGQDNTLLKEINNNIWGRNSPIFPDSSDHSPPTQVFGDGPNLKPKVIGHCRYSGENQYINMVPKGYLIEVKRSSVTRYAMWTSTSVEYRDPYLSCMLMFKKGAVKATTEQMKKKMKFKNLPNSFALFTAFDNADDGKDKPNLNHAKIFNKFAEYRQQKSIGDLSEDHILDTKDLPRRQAVENCVLMFAKFHLCPLLPLFNLPHLMEEVKIFYDNVEKTGKVSTKNGDNWIYCIILLLTKICKLAICMSNIPGDDVSPIAQLDTTRFIPLVHKYIMNHNLFRKCTLHQLQVLLLLRFYNWCAPEDGDGQQGQQNSILMGMIISSAKELGIGWDLFTPGFPVGIDISDGSRPSAQHMKAEEYTTLYQKIWCYILFWDRKMLLVNGQNCIIQRSRDTDYSLLEATFSKEDGSEFFRYFIHLDSLPLEINDLISSNPTKVNITALNNCMTSLEEEFRNIHTIVNSREILQSNDDPRFFEVSWNIKIARACILHAEVVSYEKECDFVRCHYAIQKLWEIVLSMCSDCMEYWSQRSEAFLGSLNNFYTNRIVEIAADRLVHFVKAIILRLHRFHNVKAEDKQILVQFMHKFCSLYFTNFGREYFRCFKSLFNLKMDYRVLSYSNVKDPWTVMLTFILHEMSYGEQPEGKLSLRDRLPLIAKLHDKLSYMPSSFKNHDLILDAWQTSIYPICRYDEHFQLNLYISEIKKLDEHYKIDKDKNLFESFYNNEVKLFGEEFGTQESCNSAFQKDSSEPPQETITLDEWGTLSGPYEGNDILLASETDSKALRYNDQLIQEIFNPKDFLPFL